MLVSDLILEIEDTLYSLAETRQRQAVLSGDLNATDTMFNVVDATMIDRGVVEIDYELLNVLSVDRGANTVTLFPQGRGSRGTTPAAHTNGTTVSVNPAFPKNMILREINNALDTMYPTLFRRQRFTGLAIADPPATALPAWVTSVADVRTVEPADSLGMPYEEHKANRYNLSRDANGNLCVTFSDYWDQSWTTTLTGIGKFSTPLTPTQDLTTDGGVQQGWENIIALRVIGILAQSLDIARIRTDSIEAGARAQNLPPISATNISKSYMQLWNAAMQDARRDLLNTLDARMRYTYPGPRIGEF